MPFDSNLLPSYGDTVAKTFTRAEFDASTAYVQEGTLIWITDEDLLLVADSSGTLDSITTTPPGPTGAYGLTFVNTVASTGTITPAPNYKDASGTNLGSVLLESSTYQLVTRVQDVVEISGSVAFGATPIAGFDAFIDNWPALDSINCDDGLLGSLTYEDLVVNDCPVLTEIDCPTTTLTTGGLTVVTITGDCPLLATVNLTNNPTLTNFTLTTATGNINALTTLNFTGCTGLTFVSLGGADGNGGSHQYLPTVSSGTVTFTGATLITGDANYATLKSNIEAKGYTVVDS